ncbi:DUF6236 family protein [Vibrio splendidus]|uniref:DUF6236 family protein n=1 Tax=Vibrio splendidus TaxID=29497 RepID=UPI000C826DED|nr:DUF6236 family protein [Vibrio splendidus]PMK56899.1 hypothetical protein BCT96_18565 [Vibrio splendidus]CAK2396746.1 conserved hypothetical protein [Vibrio crassostreae]CAK3924002.1 conserved hypothetical protein [Vibrio crassostreae]
MNNNGIVMSAYDVKITESRINVSADIAPEYLRYFCLYWDRIMLIDAPPICCAFNHEKQILSDAGILSVRTAHNPDWVARNLPQEEVSKELTRYVMNRHFQLASQEMGALLKEEPNQWTIHQNGNKLLLPDNHKVEQMTARMELKNCLPIPKADIPLDKVLDFKMNRADELTALHTTLTGLYLKITNSQDVITAQDYYVNQLSSAISDLNKVSKEKFGICDLANRKVSLEISQSSFFGGIGPALMFEQPIAQLGAYVVGGLVSSIKLTAEKTIEHRNATGSTQLSYLSSINKNEIAAC